MMQQYEEGFQYRDAEGVIWTVCNGGWPGYTVIDRFFFRDETGAKPPKGEAFEEWLRGLSYADGSERPFANVYWEEQTRRVAVARMSQPDWYQGHDPLPQPPAS